MKIEDPTGKQRGPFGPGRQGRGLGSSGLQQPRSVCPAVMVAVAVDKVTVGVFAC